MTYMTWETVIAVV